MAERLNNDEIKEKIKEVERIQTVISKEGAETWIEGNQLTQLEAYKSGLLVSIGEKPSRDIVADARRMFELSVVM